LKADLHIHTSKSDGSLNVAEVMLTAFNKGVRVLAVTDHDTTSGIEEAVRLGNQYGIEVIPGVEFSTSFQNEEIHLLGYYKNTDNDRLQEKLSALRRERSRFTWNMLQKLRQQGLKLEWDEVLETADAQGTICKAHIMYALKNSWREQEELDFNNIASWFRPGGAAYIPYTGNPFQGAVDFIYETSGVPVLAHPGLIRNKSLIKQLLSYRPIGLEVYYGYWENQRKLIRFFEKIASDHALLMTGGSDYHGFFSQIGIGEVFVPEQCVTVLKQFLQMG